MSPNEQIVIPASALQHYLFCPTQFALIHVQSEWEDDLNTQKGKNLHGKMHAKNTERRRQNIKQSGINLFHPDLALSCQPDRIDWEGDAPTPVEAKKGRTKESLMDVVQLQAAALCLEYLTGKEVPVGRLFYWGEQKTHTIKFTPTHRDLTLKTISNCRSLMETHATPTGLKKPCCRQCSMKYICLPR